MSRKTETTRRRFMGRIGGAAATAVLADQRKAVPQSPELPNILWIMTDEHRVDTLGCYGSPWAHSPNIDRLARRGVLFENAFVQSPICVPSRAATLTGKYAHTCEVLNNGYRLNFTSWHRRQMGEAIEKMGRDQYDKRIETLGGRGIARLKERFGENLPPQAARSFGRNVAFTQLANELGIIGKGPQHKMFPEILAEHGYQTATVGKLHHGAPRSGFQENLQVRESDYAFLFGLRKDLDPKEFGVVLHPAVPAIFAGTFPGPPSETTSAKWTDAAIDYLNNKAQEPFLFRLSLRSPHTPVLPPKPYDTMFDPKEMPIPSPSIDELNDGSRYARRRSFQDQFNEQQRRATWASYYGLAAFVDHQIGRLLDALAASPVADNTIVVLSSDHGALLGEHGLYQKGTFYHESARIPFIFSFPGRVTEGKKVGAVVESIDLAPTLFDLCGVPIPSDMEGKSLGPTMKGTESNPHDAVFSEIYTGAESSMQWLAGEPAGTIRRMIRTDEWNMSVHYPQDPVYGPDGSLFDLVEDPAETRNLYYDPKYRDVAIKLRQRIIDWTHA